MVAIFVALMFVTLVLADLVVEKVRVRRAARSLAGEAVVWGSPVLHSSAWDSWTTVPAAAYLSESHAWLLPEAKGLFRAGVDAMIGAALGRAHRIVLPQIGREVKAGEPLFHLELGERRLTVASPVSGIVVTVNSDLNERPERVAESPYGTGWVCSLRPTCLKQERSGLRLGEKAAAWLSGEFERFREFVAAQQAADLALGLTSQDGGTPVPGCLALLDRGAWGEFSRSFLWSR